MAGTQELHQPSPEEDDVGPHQLDFYQAMSDFKHMFPGMDEEIIEAVLRSNNGAVDATIDQLLTMNVDTEKKPKVPTQQDDSSSDGDDTPPPSYASYAASSTTDVATDPIPPPQPQCAMTGSLIDAPISDFLAMGNSATDSTFPVKNDAHNLETLGAVGGQQTRAPHLPLQRNGQYPPEETPMQTLPNLLDLGLAPAAPRPPPRASTLLTNNTHSFPNPSPAPPPPLPPKFIREPETFHTRSGSPRHSCVTPKRIMMKWNPPLLGSLPEDFLRVGISTGSSLRTPQGTARLNGTSSPHSPRSRSNMSTPPVMSHSSPSASPKPGELSSAILQQKMAENERRRSSMHAGDAEAQMLEDERLALMLQNEEFLAELMHDADFMNSFQRDRMNATAFEPSPSRDEHVPEAELDPDRPRPDSRKNQMEGYGDDRDKSMGAFPFDRPTTAVGNDHNEFRQQLSHMGGSSKKKFAAAAKRFFSRKKKKSPKPILRESAPSTMNLLEDEERLDDTIPCPQTDPKENEPLFHPVLLPYRSPGHPQQELAPVNGRYDPQQC